MEYKVKKAIEITLELTQKEFNTIVSAYGSSNQYTRKDIADCIGIDILEKNEADELYSRLRSVLNHI